MDIVLKKDIEQIEEEIKALEAKKKTLKARQRKITISISVPNELNTLLKNYADKNNIKVSNCFEEALIMFLKQKGLIQ